jgi:hypothetical protein
VGDDRRRRNTAANLAALPMEILGGLGVASSAAEHVTTPMWLVNDGIESEWPKSETKLDFKELIALHRDLEIDARWISEDVYRLIQSPAATTSGGTV